MSEKKEITAVEWMSKELSAKVIPLDEYPYNQKAEDIIEQAKKMEKEQMIDIGTECFAYAHMADEHLQENDAKPIAEFFYNEKYGSK